MQDTPEPYPAIDSNDSATHSTGPDDLRLLIADAISGRQKAWRDLYRRYDSVISSVARQYRLSPGNVEDVKQTVWLRLVKHLKDLREPKALPGWIVTVTRNEALRVIRMNRRWEPADPLADPRMHQVDNTQPDAHLERMECRQALHAVIGELRPKHRELVQLLLVDPPLPYSEISRRLEIPVGSMDPLALVACRDCGPRRSCRG